MQFYVGAGETVASLNLGLAPKCDMKHCLTESIRLHVQKGAFCHAAFKIRQNGFLQAGAPPELCWELSTLPRPPSRLGTFLLIPHPTRRLRHLDSPAVDARHSVPQFGGETAPNIVMICCLSHCLSVVCP